MSEVAHVSHDDHHDDHGHHHKETFVTKYIFSQDHKMISKQYLITGLIMGFIGIAMSLLFRMQLAWPGESFGIFEAVLGKWAPDGVMDADIYLALVTIHGTLMVFFVLTQGLSGTFSNLLIPPPPHTPSKEQLGGRGKVRVGVWILHKIPQAQRKRTGEKSTLLLPFSTSPSRRKSSSSLSGSLSSSSSRVLSRALVIRPSAKEMTCSR